MTILEETVKLFEKLISKFGVAMCSVLLAHPTLCAIKTLTIKGISSIEYLKIQALPLFDLCNFKAGQEAAQAVLAHKPNTPIEDVAGYLLSVIIKSNKTPNNFVNDK